MTLIRNATLAWSDPVTIQQTEIWQVRGGCVFITTTATPDSDDGIFMVLREGVRFSPGLSVRYRKEGETEALIARETV